MIWKDLAERSTYNLLAAGPTPFEKTLLNILLVEHQTRGQLSRKDNMLQGEIFRHRTEVQFDQGGSRSGYLQGEHDVSIMLDVLRFICCGIKEMRNSEATVLDAKTLSDNARLTGRGANSGSRARAITSAVRVHLVAEIIIYVPLPLTD